MGSPVGGAPGSAAAGQRKEWWESAGNKLYTIATDKTISKLMMEYKRRKQQPPPQSHVNLFMKEQGWAAERRGPVEPQRPPQRPQHLVDQQGPPLRHSVSAGPEVLRQEKRPRSASTISSHGISLRDSEAQIQVRGVGAHISLWGVGWESETSTRSSDINICMLSWGNYVRASSFFFCVGIREGNSPSTQTVCSLSAGMDQHGSDRPQSGPPPVRLHLLGVPASTLPVPQPAFLSRD